VQPEQLASEVHAEHPVGHVVHVLVPLSAIVPVGQELATTHLLVILSKKLVTQDVQFEAVVQFPQGLIQPVQVPLLLK
jgi:hypothetical protein